MSITRYTTPPISLLVKGEDITSATEIHVTIKQGMNEIDLTGNDITAAVSGDDTQITFSLTQQQSGSLGIAAGIRGYANFANAYADVQVNWIAGGVRYATEIVRVKVYDNLLDEVIS